MTYIHIRTLRALPSTPFPVCLSAQFMAERRCTHCRCLKAWQQLTNIGVVLIRVTGKVNSDVYQAVNPTTFYSPAAVSAGVLSGPRERRLTDGADAHRAVRFQSLAPRDQPLTLGTHAYFRGSHSRLELSHSLFGR